MKIGVILYQNMRHAPFLRFYENVIDGIKGAEYDIIYLNRNPDLHELDNDRHIAIKWFNNSNFGMIFAKIVSALCFPFQAIRIIKQKKYDYLVLLTTMPAILLYPFLKRNYDGKYIVDIRDYTKEHWRWYKFIERRVVAHSSLNIVSSPAFKKFLPVSEYHVCHNLNASEEGVQKNLYHFEQKSRGKIIISYVGIIQYADQCIRLIDLVVNDPRFEMRFYGNEVGEMMVTKYVERLNTDKIKMMGEFLPEEKPKIYAESDLIFNCYGNDSPLVKHLISNRYYDGALYRRPLMVSPNTTMSDLVGSYGFSIDLMTAKDLDLLYNWYCELDSDGYEEFAQNVLVHALSENKVTANKIRQVICMQMRQDDGVVGNGAKEASDR